MFQQSTLDFLAGLKANNNKEWFEANRKSYEAARKNMINFTAELISKIGKWEEGISKLQPKDCLFRINRDIRFSADKSPYKTNMGCWLNSGGKNSNKAGYYFHLQPGEAFLAGGIYMPMSNDLKAIRQEIDYNLEEFESILSDKDFKKYFGTIGGEKLKTTPKDYAKDNPAIEYLKHKSLIASHKLKDEDLTKPDLADKVEKAYRAMHKFNTFLSRALE